MPRKRRLTKPRRIREAAVSRALAEYLLWYDITAAADTAEADGTSPWELFDSGAPHQRAWAVIADRALAEWVHVFPGRRPRSWWLWSAPELRRVVSGRYAVSARALERCRATGIPYGSPDWDDLPAFESTPAYLDRLSLWLPGERAQVESNEFIPEHWVGGPQVDQLFNQPRLDVHDDDAISREGRS